MNASRQHWLREYSAARRHRRYFRRAHPTSTREIGFGHLWSIANYAQHGGIPEYVRENRALCIALGISIQSLMLERRHAS